MMSIELLDARQRQPQFISIAVKPQEHSPSIDFLKSDEPFVVTRFIFVCCKKLDAQAITVATATSLFHRFFKNARVPEAYDPYLIATACIYLAGKVEDNHLRIRDLINVVHTTLHRSAEPLGLDNEYYNFREAIVQAELLVLRMVGFQTKFSHPHKFLLHYLKSLRDWFSPEVWKKLPVAQTSWSILQDYFHDPAVLGVNQSHLALACIALALQIYGVQVPGMSDADSKPWHKVLCDSASKDKVWDMMTKVMDVYNREAELIEPLKVIENED